MNSYPHEFLAHHVPLMFVAGLDDPGKTEPASRRTSLTGEGITKPDVMVTAPDPFIGTTAASQEQGKVNPFADLHVALRTLFSKQSEKSKLWLKERDKELFRILLVEKNVRLPPRKINSAPPAGSTNQATSVPHSALSPLSTHSPVYPDGLISPMWIRKHSEIVPSVFVLFLNLPDFGLRKGRSRSGSTVSAKGSRSRAGSIASKSTVGSPDIAQELGLGVGIPTSGSSGSTNSVLDDAQRQTLQSQADEILIREIADRKKKTAERGIKLTVVLLAGRDMLDDTGLDARLSAIRRQSGLDSRASLFVLTPVGDDELVEFAASLQDSLFDPAQEYYANHYKRNRRKRSKLPANPATPPYAAGAVGQGGKPLSSQGWAVRYDYKAGVFAEVRGETEVARKHLEDSWHGLVALFVSPAALPARTKRWAEAKVLADCIAVKVCRLHLYHADAAAASAFFHRHLSRFSQLSKGWAIGEETFEYWSWMGRQYRIFAELLELALAAGLRITLPLPAFAPGAMAVDSMEPDSVTSVVNPTEVLQHPGYYWYMAGRCSVDRRNAFRALSLKANAADTAPGFTNEQKADHAAIIVELFTKAYTSFKTQQPAQTRMSLTVACRIAETYAFAEQQEMAMKFFERIGKTYRREGWRSVTWSLQALRMEAAKSTGSVETVARILWDSMAPDGLPPSAASRDVQEELLGLLTTSIPTSTQVIEIDQETSRSLFGATGGFWAGTAVIGEVMPWRITLTASPRARFGNLVFDSVIVQLTGDAGEHHFVHDIQSGAFPQSGDRVRLDWTPGCAVSLQGSSEQQQPGDVGIEACTMVYKQGPWTFHLPVTLTKSSPSTHGVWDHRVIRYSRRPRNVQVGMSWAETVCTNETAQHNLRIRNLDSDPFEGQLRVEVSSTGRLHSTIHVGGANGRGELKSFAAPLAAGAEVTIPISVRHDQAGAHHTKVFLHDDKHGSTETDFEWGASHVVHVHDAFSVEHQVQCKLHPGHPALSDDQDAEAYWEALVATEIRSQSSQPLKIQRIRYIDTPFAAKRLSYSSVVSELDHAEEMDPGDATSAVHIFRIDATANDGSPTATPIPGGRLEVEWVHTEGGDESSVVSTITIPPIILPVAPAADVLATLNAPPVVHLAKPLDAVLEVHNRSAIAIMSDLTLSIEASDAFVWKGQRHCRLPLLLPGQRWTLRMTLIAVGLSGQQILPRMHLTASSGTELQREIEIISAPWQAQATMDGMQVLVQP